MDTVPSLLCANSPHDGLNPTLATSKVLRNQDLLNLIFSCLVDYKPDTRLNLGTSCSPRAGLAGLLRVGLACRAFVEPMLDLLWYEMNTLIPLLRLISKVTMEEGVYTSSSVILPMDLQIFQSYSCRIRHIHFYTFRQKVSSHIYSSITRHLFTGNSSLFPALRCFGIHSFDNISEENLLVLPLIIPSALSTLDIRRIKGPMEIHLASFLSGIAHSSSMNQSLSLLRLEGTLTTSTLTQIGYFKSLTTLELFIYGNGAEFPHIILASISKLPLLTKFMLTTIVYDGRSSSDTEKPPVCHFPNLQTLELRGAASVILRILQSIHGEQLLGVTLTLSQPSANDAIKACIKQCPETAPHMRSYSIVVHGVDLRSCPDMFAPLLNSYPPLCHLTIETVAIPIQHFRGLFDHSRVGFLWLALETLKFPLQVGQDFRSRWPGIHEIVPLSSLPMLAESCPKLHTLHIYLYYPRGKGDDENKLLEHCIQSSQPKDHKLTNLKIIFWDPFFSAASTPGDITSAITVSRFVDHIFPNVQNVDISDAFDKGRKGWCSGITTMMKNYRDVRKRTRAEREPIVPS